jgi:hypothetical protein
MVNLVRDLSSGVCVTFAKVVKRTAMADGSGNRSCGRNVEPKHKEGDPLHSHHNLDSGRRGSNARLL